MRSQKGQSLTEFALVLPLLLTLLFGITDFGRIFYDYLTLDYAGREAARVASIGGTDAQIQAKVAQTTPALDSKKLTITISPDQSSRTSGTDATITLIYPVDFITPFIGSLIPPFTLTDKTVMRVE